MAVTRRQAKGQSAPQIPTPKQVRQAYQERQDAEMEKLATSIINEYRYGLMSSRQLLMTLHWNSRYFQRFSAVANRLMQNDASIRQSFLYQNVYPVLQFTMENTTLCWKNPADRQESLLARIGQGSRGNGAIPSPTSGLHLHEPPVWGFLNASNRCSAYQRQLRRRSDRLPAHLLGTEPETSVRHLDRSA